MSHSFGGATTSSPHLRHFTNNFTSNLATALADQGQEEA
jgi:hypothetical protein